MTYRIGIDAGSKTLKIVVLDEAGSVVYSTYMRHRANIARTLNEAIHDLNWRLGEIDATVAITGSAAIEIAHLLGIPFVQEVSATTHAVRTLIPQADVAIELGGEDAKIIYLTDGIEQRMNATCAGGTGGFIDTIAYMLGERASNMSSLAFGSSRTYPIASRCAVFAQTDVRPLLNAGVSKADIAASTFDAVVRQTLGGLACGRPIRGNVVFLGGPLEHMPYLVSLFRQTLDLKSDQGIKPKDAHLFTVHGTALLSDDEVSLGCSPLTINTANLLERIENMGEVENDLERLPALFESEEELLEFRERHSQASFPRKSMSDATGPLFLGIDAGSTTLKIAVLDEDGALVHSAYEPIRGDMIETLRDMLASLHAMIDVPSYLPNAKPKAWIARACATGYGEELLRAAFGVDMGVVETAAHLRAATQLCPDVSFVLDIGGQDMKALWVNQGMVVDAALNEACSSGCGAFIEGTAAALKSTPWSFSDDALKAEEPIDLGTKCTVFMSSRVKHAQKAGASIEDIAAGVAYSVVKNALHRIIGDDRMPMKDDRVVVQGGTFKSDAVLRAFEQLTGIEAIRPVQTHLMGAIGCAFFARDACANLPGKSAHDVKSSIITAAELENLAPKRKRLKCTGCTNGCMLSVVTFDEDETRYFISDNKCENGLQELGRRNLDAHRDARVAEYATHPASRQPHASQALGEQLPAERNLDAHRDARVAEYATHPASRQPHASQALGEQLPQERNLDASAIGAAPDVLATPPNLIACEQQLLSSFGTSEQEGPRGHVRVGLLDSMEMYASKPFWHTLLKELGFSIVLPRAGCEAKQASEAWETIPSESVCFPAKTSHMRYFSLCDEGADAVLMIRFDRGNHCPVEASYARVLMQNAVDSRYEGKPAPIVTPMLCNYKPRLIANHFESREAVRRALNAILRECGGEAGEISPLEFDRALYAALIAQDAVDYKLELETEKAMRWLSEDPSRHGIVLAGRPYHTDEALMHGIDRELVRLGFAVFGAAGLSTMARGFRGNQYKGKYPWKPAKRLARLAHFTAVHPQLDAVFLEAFGCGFEAVSLEEAKDILDAVGKPCTVLKIDDISDIAHIRIRLRTLAAAIEMRKTSCIKLHQNSVVENVAAYAVDSHQFQQKWPKFTSLAEDVNGIGQNQLDWQETDVNSNQSKLFWPPYRNQIVSQHDFGHSNKRMLCQPASNPGVQNSYASLIKDLDANPLDFEDLETERRDCVRDVCFTADIIAARVIRMLRENPNLQVIELPNVCENCLTEAIPRMVERATGLSPNYIWIPWDNKYSTRGMSVSRGLRNQWGRVQLVENNQEGQAPLVEDALSVGAGFHPVNHPERIGIVGNPLIVFEPFMNDGIIAKLQDLGCEPVLPDPQLLFVEDVRYIDQLRAFEEQGITDVIYLMSFGCLKGHTNARGALRELKELFPNMQITVIDYDPEASALNRENRLRLAVESARMRTDS